ncbi:hypothetical protein LLOABG_LLOABG_04745, partial [Dysosmobacter welbionis]
PICRHCCICAAMGPGDTSMTMILCGRLWRMRPSLWSRRWSGACSPSSAW